MINADVLVGMDDDDFEIMYVLDKNLEVIRQQNQSILE